MSTATTRNTKNTQLPRILYLAFELALDHWKLAFATEQGEKIRIRTITARDIQALEREVGLARTTFNLPELSPVVSCYEAGRDGFWLHRHLESENFTNYVVDPASVETSRRGKKAKTDRIDVRKHLTTLSIQDHVKATTAPYKYPRSVEFVTELPKTISGKIRRVELREAEFGKADGGST